MQKLIRKHQWITKPDKNGISYFGLTNFAKDYLLRFVSITHQQYHKTRYSIMRRNSVSRWLQNIKDKYKISSLAQMNSNIQKITISQQMQFKRFCINRDEPFTQLNTIQFDVQLSAPIAMRVLQCNFQAQYYTRIYQVQWLYKVELLDNDMTGLLTQQQYEKSNKVIQYDGMLF